MGAFQSRSTRELVRNQGVLPISNHSDTETLEHPSQETFEQKLNTLHATSTLNKAPAGSLPTRRPRRRKTPPQHPTPISPAAVLDDLNIRLVISMLHEYVESGDAVNPQFSHSVGFSRIPYPISCIEEFNLDIILEVLRHYVASQTDGVFILMLVSKAWQDFVLQTPILWRWITIDELSSDWFERSTICSSLASFHPLQIVVRLPLTNWSHIVGLLPRAGNIFFEIPEYMTGNDVREETHWFLTNADHPAGCRIHWYHIGGEFLKESREPMSLDIGKITDITLWANGSEHPQYRSYAETRDIRHLETGDEFNPRLLLKIFHILEVLRNSINLHTLSLSHYAVDPISSDINLPVVVMSRLQDLEIIDIDHSLNGTLLPLVESIHLPSISTISLAGECADTLDMANHFLSKTTPSAINLRFTTCFGSPSQALQHTNSVFITSVSFHVEQSPSNNEMKSVILGAIRPYFRTLSGILHARFSFPLSWYKRDDIFTMPSTAQWPNIRSFMYTGEGFPEIFTLCDYSFSPNLSRASFCGSSTLISKLAQSYAPRFTIAILDIEVKEDRAFNLPFTALGSQTDKSRGLETTKPSIIQLIEAMMQSASQLSQVSFVFPLEWYLHYEASIMPSTEQWHNLRRLMFAVHESSRKITLFDYAFSPALTKATFSGVRRMIFKALPTFMPQAVATSIEIKMEHAALRNSPLTYRTGGYISLAIPVSESIHSVSVHISNWSFDDPEVGSVLEDVQLCILWLSGVKEKHVFIPPDWPAHKRVFNCLRWAGWRQAERVLISAGTEDSAELFMNYKVHIKPSVMEISGTSSFLMELTTILREDMDLRESYEPSGVKEPPYIPTSALLAVLDGPSWSRIEEPKFDSSEGRGALDYMKTFLDEKEQEVKARFIFPLNLCEWIPAFTIRRWSRSFGGPPVMGTPQEVDYTLTPLPKFIEHLFPPPLTMSGSSRFFVNHSDVLKTTLGSLTTGLGLNLSQACYNIPNPYMHIHFSVLRRPMPLMEFRKASRSFVSISERLSNATSSSLLFANCCRNSDCQVHNLEYPELLESLEDSIHKWARGNTFEPVVSLHFNIGGINSSGYSQQVSTIGFCRWLRNMRRLTVVRLSLPPEWVAGRGTQGEPPCESNCSHLSNTSTVQNASTAIYLASSSLLSFQDLTYICELDIRLPGQDMPCEIVENARFSALRSLKCTPFILLPILSGCQLPSLCELHLHWPGGSLCVESELQHFDDKITHWVETQGFRLCKILIFGVSWFPDWKVLTRMLRSLAEAQGEQLAFSLILPAHPHPDIQSLLALVMNPQALLSDQEDLPQRPAFWKFRELAKSAPIGTSASSHSCYFCMCGKLECRFDQPVDGSIPHCSLYSLESTVRIKSGIHLPTE